MVTVRVLLVDDDALVRAGLRMILSSSDEIEVVARHLCGQRRVVRIPDEAVLAADKAVAEAFFDALAASFSKSCSACGRELT